VAQVRKRQWTNGKGVQEAWVADYLDQAGKRHIKTFPTKREASAWLVKTQTEVSQGTHTPERESITVAEAADIWLERSKLENLERSTLVQYRSHVDLRIKPSRIGSEKLARLTTPAVEAFRDELLAKVSRALARKVLVSLKSILSEAQRRGLVAHNAAQPVRVDTKKRDQRRLAVGRDIPTKEEVQRLLATASGRWRPLLATAVFTGLRASELRGLTWSDVDFTKNVLHVRQRADLWCDIGAPKSAAGAREVLLAPMVVNTLKEWKLACPQGEAGLVFPNGDGKVECTANIARRGLKPLQVEAGIVDAEGEAKYGLHSLRHFFASWIIEQGFSPKRAQALLGHSSIQLTFDVYGHLFPSLEDDRAKFAAGQLLIVGC
jgi:integrase